MKGLKLDLPVGGSVTFRNLVGKISLVPSLGGRIAIVSVDSANSLESKRRVIPLLRGLPEQKPDATVYHDLQVHVASDFTAGTRVVDKKGVYDLKGRKATPDSISRIESFGIELDVKSQKPVPNIWIGWTITKVGDLTIRVLADGKVVRERKVHATPVPAQMLANVRSFADLRFSVHLDTRAREDDKFQVGDVVAFGFRVDEVQDIRVIGLKA